MEGYRSYSDGRPPYPEAPYRDSHSGEADYPEPAGWYGERPTREPDRYEAERYETDRYEPERYDDRPRREPERFDEPRREPPRPGPAEPARASAPSPRAAPPPADEPPAPPPPQAPRRPPVAPGSPGPAGEGVYRSKRPATALLLGAPAAVLELPALMLLWDAAFGDPASASGVVAAACMIMALPLLAIGLYAVATGAVRAAGPNSVQAWLRPPVAYLTVALILFVAAGAAG